MTQLILKLLVEQIPVRYRDQSVEEWQTWLKQLSKAGQGQANPDDIMLSELFLRILFVRRPDFDPRIKDQVYGHWLALVIRYFAPFHAPLWPQKWTIDDVDDVFCNKANLLGDLLFGDERVFRQALAAVATTRKYVSQHALSKEQKELLDCIQNMVIGSDDVESLIRSWTNSQLEDLVNVIKILSPRKKVPSVPPRTLLIVQTILRRPHTRPLFIMLFLIILVSVGELADVSNVLPPGLIVFARILVLIDFLGFAALYAYSFWKDQRSIPDESEI